MKPSDLINTAGHSFPVTDLYWFDYPISSGVGVPVQTITNDYDSTGSTVLMSDTTNYFYDNPTLYMPTRTITSDIKAISIETHAAAPA